MKPMALKTKGALALVIGAILAAGPAMAEKPSWAGGGKEGKEQRKEQRDEQKGQRRDDDKKARRDGPATVPQHHFQDQHRTIVHEYYVEQYRSGRCPPGLRKKQNGCMPPGQAKKWQIGRPLPREVVYYEVPQTLVMQIGPPPSGYRYVRVASDILMIAIGTGMIVDAIQDLNR